jgi:hypothetical protein
MPAGSGQDALLARMATELIRDAGVVSKGRQAQAGEEATAF